MLRMSSTAMRGNLGPIFMLLCLLGGLFYTLILYRGSSRRLMLSEAKVAKLTGRYNSLTSQLNGKRTTHSR